MKKALLIFPYLKCEEIQYPTGLYKIASHCKKEYNIIVLDERVENDIVSAIEKEIDDNLLCIGFSVMTGEQILSAIKLSEKFHNNKTCIVWGGMHPTLTPSDTVNNPFIDYVVVGDGEQAFLELLQDIDTGKRHHNGYISSPNDTVVFNQYSNFNNPQYVDFVNYPIKNEYFVKRDGFERAFTLETSRGCPYRCKFCHNSTTKRKYISLDSDYVIRTIKYLVNSYNIDGIVFQEDNFFVQDKRVDEIVEYLKTLPNVGWKANCRIDLFLRYTQKEGTIKKLIDSGLKVIQFGIESGSQEILDSIDKQIDLADVEKVNKELANYNIRVRYNFIVGFPNENIDDVDKTFSLINKLKNDNANIDPPFVNIYTPYPGTMLYNTCVAKGYNEPKTLTDWSKVNWNSVHTNWLDTKTQIYIETQSRKYYEKSKYLKG